jgi:TPP-dependent trihydroxycyclohexane-1,2-dione (THcHDO) dehydratase
MKASASTLIYDAKTPLDVVKLVSSELKAKIELVDARGDISENALSSAIAKLVNEKKPVVVLLGAELSDGARAALSSLDDNRVIAVSSAHAPSPAMSSMFPLRIAASVAVVEEA